MACLARPKVVASSSWRVVATQFPFFKNVHTTQGKYSTFYALVEYLDGKRCAFVGIVEAPNNFNDRVMRSNLARQVTERGTRLTYRQAAAVFDVHPGDYAF